MQIFDYVFRSVQGVTLPMERWRGQPILVVNTASQCGFTPQYGKLEAVWNEYRRSGLVVLGIPCNDFGEQEPGTSEEIAEFCSTNYGVTFPVTEKQSIIGPSPHPMFVAMRDEYTPDILPKWNFHKYLFGRDGDLVENWGSRTEPDDPGFRHQLERNLGSWRL